MFPLLARGFLLLGAWGAPEAGGFPGHPAQEPQAPEAAPEAAPEVTPEQHRLESLFAGAFVGVRDYEEFAETRGYRELLEALARYGEQELAQKAQGQLDVASVFGNPNVWRGKIVRARALLVKLETVRLVQPLGDRIDVYRAYLSQPDGSEHLVVDFLEEPPALEEENDVVDLEGIFFRIVRWENAKGDPVYAPQMIARSLRKFDQQQAPRKTIFKEPLAQLTLGAALVYLVMRVILFMRRKKSDPRAAATARAIHERANRPRPKPHP